MSTKDARDLRQDPGRVSQFKTQIIARTQICDIGNLHAADGALFPTSSGFNPILTITAVGAWVGASMTDAERPASSLIELDEISQGVLTGYVVRG